MHRFGAFLTHPHDRPSERENAGVLPSAADLSTIVDLDRYPIDDLDGAKPVIDAGDGTVGRHGRRAPARVPTRRSLGPDRGRGRPPGGGCGNFQDVPGTPYLGFPDESFPPDHPRQYLSRSALTAVAYDLFPDDSLLRALYEWDGLMQFVSAVLGGSRLYRYADPLGALNVATMSDDRRARLAFRPDRLRRVDRPPVERRGRRVRGRSSCAIVRRRVLRRGGAGVGR